MSVDTIGAAAAIAVEAERGPQQGGDLRSRQVALPALGNPWQLDGGRTIKELVAEAPIQCRAQRDQLAPRRRWLDAPSLVLGRALVGLRAAPSDIVATEHLRDFGHEFVAEELGQSLDFKCEAVGPGDGRAVLQAIFGKSIAH